MKSESVLVGLIGRVREIEEKSDGFKSYVDFLFIGGKMNLRTRLDKLPADGTQIKARISGRIETIVMYNRATAVTIHEELVAVEPLK